MKPLTVAIVKSGLVPPDVLGELRRWGLPVEVEGNLELLSTAEDVVAYIQDALEGEDLVQLRDTDLDIIHKYITGQQAGKLHVETDGTKSNIAVSYCRTDMGHYVIPWRSESIKELITDPNTYLKTAEGKVYFRDARELFFGGHKTFMVCEPSQETHNGT